MKQLLAWTSGYTITWGTLSFVALTIGVLADGYGFGLTQAGLLATTELLAMTLSVFIVGPLTKTSSLSRLAGIGAVVAAAGNFCTAHAHQLIIVAVLRAIAGAGAGVVAAASNTAMSRARDPSRAYAVANLGYVIISGIYFAGMPLIYSRISYGSYFLAYAVFFLVAAWPLLWLPTGASSPGHDEPLSTTARTSGWGAAAVCAAFLIWLSYSVLWSICQRVAVSIGISDENIGYIFSAGTFAGLIGAFAAWALGARVGRTPPLIIGAASLGLCYVLLTITKSSVVYAWTMIFFGVAICFYLPYLMGFSATLDQSGSVSRKVGAVMPLATALGPLIGAWLSTSYSFSMVGGAAAAATTSACCLIAAASVATRLASEIT